jgi:lipopolysaccharide biosynthesis glycosyltransferase
MYTGNDYVFKGIVLSTLSILKHTNEEVHVYLVTMDIDNFKGISSEMANKLDTILKEKNINNKCHLINMTDLFNSEMKDSKNINSFYTPYCLLRLFSDKLDLPNKILYLDTDTMINKDIKSLYDIDITNYEFAGVIDRLGRFFIDKNYINSGVLLLNLDMIRKTELFKNTRELVKTKKMAFPDQSALNKLKKHYLKIPSIYNSQRYLKKDTVVKHFCKSIRWLPIYHTINVKPWEVEKVHRRLKIRAYDDIYLKYEEIMGEKLC